MPAESNKRRSGGRPDVGRRHLGDGRRGCLHAPPPPRCQRAAAKQTHGGQRGPGCRSPGQRCARQRCWLGYWCPRGGEARRWHRSAWLPAMCRRKVSRRALVVERCCHGVASCEELRHPRLHADQPALYSARLKACTVLVAPVASSLHRSSGEKKNSLPAGLRTSVRSAWAGLAAGCLHTLSGPDHLAVRFSTPRVRPAICKTSRGLSICLWLNTSVCPGDDGGFRSVCSACVVL